MKSFYLTELKFIEIQLLSLQYVAIFLVTLNFDICCRDKYLFKRIDTTHHAI